jgi:hypothetical protein
MAGKKIFIEYDIDSSDLKIAGQETLSLTQQLRILKKELQKADLGTKEFEILRRKIGDTEDAIAKTNVKSKDFFGILSTLPGPVGAFGGSLLSVVDTLKVFSSFTFKDIKNSLNDVVDDVVEITRNFFGLAKATDTATVATEANVVATNTLTAAQTAATVATKALKLALATLGIGLIIIAVSELISLIIEWTDTTKKAEAAQKKFNDEIERTNEILDLDLKSAKRRNDLRMAELKAQGATEQQLQQESVRAQKETLKLKQDALEEAKKLETATLKREDEKAAEDLKKIGQERTRLEQEIADAQNQIKITALNQTAAALEKRRTVESEFLQKLEEDTKTANEKLSQLQLDFLELTSRNINDFNRQKLALEFQQEQNEITQLKLKDQKINGIVVTGQELRNRLLIQSKENYLLRVKELDEEEARQIKEVGDRALGLQKQFSDKLNLLIVESTENEYEKRKKQRELNYQKEKEDLIKLEGELIAEYNKLIELYPEGRQEVEDLITSIIAKSKSAQLILEKNYQTDLIKIGIQEKSDRAKLLSDALDSEIRIQELRNQTLTENTQEFFRNREELLNNLYFKEFKQAFDYYENLIDLAAGNAELEKTLEQQKNDELLAIDEKFMNDRKNLKQQEMAAYGQVISQTISSFASVTAALASGLDEEAKVSKKAFDQRKKLQVATATMSAASGIVQILSQPSTLPSPFDWIVKGVNAAALAISTAVQISNIKKTQFEGSGGGTGGNRMGRGYANGGLVTGPGTSTSDSIPARLSNGEAVMTAGAVTMFAPMLSMMNQMGGGTSFSNQVSNTLPDKPSVSNTSQEPVIMKTYVVESELTSIQQRQARLKNLSTL